MEKLRKKNQYMSTTKKLLIAGGCSVTDKNYYDMWPDLKVWPDIVGEHLGIDVLNVALQSASNDYISNSVMDAIIDNPDVEPIVMVLWTSPNRTSLWDMHNYAHVPIHQEGRDNLESKHPPLRHLYNYIDENQWNAITDYSIANYNLRCMFRLTEFCKKRSLKFYQMSWASLITNIVKAFPSDHVRDASIEQWRLEKLIDAIPKNRYFSPDYFCTQSYRYNMKWVGDKDWQVDVGHPNQKGHDWLAEAFLLLKESVEIQEENVDVSATGFVYD